MPINCLFPGGKKKAITLSYDDGFKPDVKLVEMLNKYDLKGTFHLNGGLLGTDGRLCADEIIPLFKGHEISAHALTHQSLTVCPREKLIDEIMKDREILERLTGKIIRGMSYPYGSVNDFVVEMIKSLGMEYSRTVHSTKYFHLPDDFLRWNATCHHNESLHELTDIFLDDKNIYSSRLFYIWGHSFEFERDGNWDMMEEFCKKVSGREDVWFATNIEICDYLNAYRSLRFSADLKMVLNKSAMNVAAEIDGQAVEIPAGIEMVI
ncbi:MAG: polysaccharide deacetylase family protein [Clostridiales bacterium]|jgi:peptidoglycan/xylan/chitin deacetylase (PgdA/CDA1 family)|nr:polysaccharide deacetylase family protein [Clostridiales bacterium]